MSKQKNNNRNRTGVKVAASIGIAALLLVVGIGTSGIYARYTSNATGTTSARIATFSFNLNGQTAANRTENSNSATIEMDDLFANSYVDTTTGGPYDNTSVHMPVDGEGNDNASGTNASTHVLAPGTRGYTPFRIVNTGEVAIETTDWVIEQTNSNNSTSKIPLEYAISSSTAEPTSGWTSLTGVAASGNTYRSQLTTNASGITSQVSGATLTVPAYLRKVIPAHKTDTTTYYLHWRWKNNESDNTQDTVLGDASTTAASKSTTPKVHVALTVTVRQHIEDNAVKQPE